MNSLKSKLVAEKARLAFPSASTGADMAGKARRGSVVKSERVTCFSGRPRLRRFPFCRAIEEDMGGKLLRRSVVGSKYILADDEGSVRNSASVSSGNLWGGASGRPGGFVVGFGGANIALR